MMEDVFLRLLDMSLISSYCIAFVLLIRLLLRKSPKVFSYLLWIAVFARLAFPLMLESPISLVPQSIGSQSVSSWIYKDNAQTANQTPALSNEISKDTLENPANAVSPGTQTAPQAALPAAEAGSDITAAEAKSLSVPFIFSIVWVIGLVALAAYNLGAYSYLKRQLKSATRIDEKIYESSSISSPFLLGLFRPKIYLPAGLQDSYRTYILRHEQIHMQRGDYAVKAILFAITCVHWFNPLVWLAFGLMSRDMEMSCDEKVIRELGYDIRKNYSTSLLSLATGRSLLHATPLAFGEGNIKGRIKNVLNYKKPALWIILGSAVLVGIVVVGLILNPLQAKKAKKTDEPAVTTTTTTAETTAETTATMQTTTSVPEPTELVLDERYDNWFIDVDGEKISFREVLEMYGDYGPFDYGSPADYKTVTPVDVSDFEAVFTDSGYEVPAETSISDDSVVSEWNAESPDGKDTVTCTTYETEADANLAISQFAVRWHYDYAITDSTAAPLETTYTDSALIIYDAGNFAGDDYFVIQYQSGNSVISARIYVEIQRLQDFFTSMETLGLPFPGVELNKNENTWPEKAVLGSSSTFVDYFTGRGYSAYESPNYEGLFHAESEDLNFQANYRPETDKTYIDWAYLWHVTGVFRSNFDYYSTNSYQMFVLSSPIEYIVFIYIDDVCISAWVNISLLSEADAAKMREEVDTVILDLCFPE